MQAWDRADTAAKHAQARVKAFDEGLAGCRVLLCEDNYLNAEIAQLLLKNKKVKVDWAKDGQEGVAKFSSSAPGYYQLVLMDIRMPVLDGLQATQAIRKLDRPDAKTIPVLAMTADAFDETIEAARKAGMDSYITKPIVPMVLYKTMFENLASCARR